MRLTIRNKLLIGFALLVLLSSLIQVFTFGLMRDYITSQINILLQDKALTAANQIDDFFQTIQTYNLDVGRIYRRNQDANDTSLLTTMENITENVTYVDSITILSDSGKELLKVDANGKFPDEKLSYEIPTSQFISAKAGKNAISKVYYLPSGSGNSGPHIDVFSPVFANKNTIIGVIKMEIDLNRLWDIISHIKFGNNGFAYIVDNQGRLIAHPNQNYVSQRPILIGRKIITETLAGQVNPQSDNNIYVNEKNIEVVSQAVKITSTDWLVVFEQPSSEAYSFLTYVRNLFIVTSITSIILLLLLSFFMSSTLTRPIIRLQQATKLIEEGDLQTHINLQSGDETESLANAFNEMAGRLYQREQLLQKESKEKETLLQSLSDGVIVVNKNNSIILMNRAARKITGTADENTMGKYINSIFPLYDGDNQVFFEDYRWQMDALKPKLKNKGFEFKTPDNKSVILSVRVGPVLFEDQTQYGWVITFHDITKEQELEDMKLDFVSMAAHELRTPLTSIRGYTSLLRDGYMSKLDDEGQTYIKRLVLSTRNLAGLIDNLLNVSRIEKNTFKVELAPVDLIKIVSTAISSLEEQAKTKKQTINFIPPMQQLPFALADSARIEQVLINLVANAINYTQEGGKIDVSVQQKDSFLQVSVKDNGMGIPKEALPKLFSKFFRVTGVLEQGSKGTGLGLFISKSIIDLHHGEIHAESEEGKGSNFVFTLPIANSTIQTNETVNKPVVSNNKEDLSSTKKGVIPNKEMADKRFGPEYQSWAYAGSKSPKKLLLVEDDLYIRELYQAAFQKAGYNIETAVDGQDGIEKYKKTPYELILLDIMMPKLNGIDVLKSIRNSNTDNTHVPIFLLTNLGQESIIKEAFTLGADGYFMKAQLLPSELVAEVTKYLESLRRFHLEKEDEHKTLNS